MFERKIDENRPFADLEKLMFGVKAAIDRAAALEAQQNSTSAEKETQKAAAEVAACTLNSLCTQWQI